jgi:hypothetical protein
MKFTITKKDNKVVLKLNHYSSNKEWVAKITGKDSQYRFTREFLRSSEGDWSGSGKTGVSYYELEDGIYQFKSPYDNIYFIQVQNGEWKILEQSDVEAFFEQQAQE